MGKRGIRSRWTVGKTHISPTMPKEPNGRTSPLMPIQPRDILRLARIPTLPTPDFCLGAIDLDVTGRATGVWFAGIGAADVGDFEHHVRFPVFVPERDADIGATVT